MWCYEGRWWSLLPIAIVAMVIYCICFPCVFAYGVVKVSQIKNTMDQTQQKVRLNLRKSWK